MSLSSLLECGILEGRNHVSSIFMVLGLSSWNTVYARLMKQYLLFSKAWNFLKVLLSSSVPNEPTRNEIVRESYSARDS